MSTTPFESAPARRFETVDDWLAYLETLHPKKIDMSLDRVRRVLATLSLTAPPYRVITVGGTNGKGSCVAILESVLGHAGHTVGAFTSPHLWRFNERIRVDSRDATDAELIELFELVDAALGKDTLTYFESSAVAALLHFARSRVDVAILEVGMGGRLDAVNALDADLALIASVDLDHEDWLGPDREAIGREKAGIMRPDRPVIIAASDPPQSLLDAVRATGARARLIGQDFRVEPHRRGLVYRGAGGASRTFPRPPFGGDIQLVNVAACIAAFDELRSLLAVDDGAVERGLADVRLFGRIERRIVDGVDYVFDVAHNPAAAAVLRAELDRLPRAERTAAVFGALQDKDLAGILGPFISVVDAWFVGEVDSERGASTALLRATLDGLGARSLRTFLDIGTAAVAARDSAANRIVVFGSFYSVGPAMTALGIYCPTSSAG